LKEIAVQNACLNELEKIVAKSSSTLFGHGKTADLKSSKEYNHLKEENRVVSITGCFMFESHRIPLLHFFLL
jgi:hypothetical protein